ncbi:fungal-specific transcription factor domain-containing protein [Amylostereum chailletii]|nr:fungal-specific transcription factor domain-containing protein [Amylostereum chailletii]
MSISLGAYSSHAYTLFYLSRLKLRCPSFNHLLDIYLNLLYSRCSRVFPCASCVKKGCAAICPDGSLTTGKGNRFILANTEVLHEKIGQLASRVRQLEDALSESHSYYARDRHPLLTDELLQIKRPLEREAKNERPPEPEAEADEAIDAVGSLSISNTGKTNFFGQTANSWYLLQNEEGSGEEDEAGASEVSMPNDVTWLSHSFPFTQTLDHATAEHLRATIISRLPDASKARHLIDIYYQHAGWMYRPVDPTEMEAIFIRVYEPQVSLELDTIQSHRVAVIYMMLAIGALMDLERPAYSYDANHYYQLARAALAVDSVFEEQSIPAIQALVLMAHYMFFAEIHGPRWALMGIVVKLAHSVSLHRDSGRWGLDATETLQRRALLWEIVTYDSWQSLTYGRPPSFSMMHIDCQMAHETYTNEKGEEEMSFEAWKHRFASQCLSIVHDQAFGARTPSYKVIQDLDRRVRNFYIPPSLQVPGFGGPMADQGASSVSLTMQRYIGFAIREITLFYMHRGFFARALEDNTDDPLGSKFAPSVLAAYNSACSFVGLIKTLFAQYPRQTERTWFLFTHVFSCAIVLGSIPIKCPALALSRSALSHLEAALRLFEQVTGNPRSAKVLPVLRKLRERAMESMAEAGASTQSPSGTPERERDVKRENEELATLGGKTRLVARKSSSQASSPASNAQSPSPRNSPVVSQSHAQSISMFTSPVPPPIQQIQQQVLPTQPTLHSQQPGPSHHTHYSQPQQMPYVQDPMSQWNGYVQSPSQLQSGVGVDFNPVFTDYTQYTLPPEPWQQAPPLTYSYPTSPQPINTQMDYTMNQQQQLYGSPSSFDYAASMRAGSYLASGQSPLGQGQQMQGQQMTEEISPTTDPTSAWHTLFSQLNHA